MKGKVKVTDPIVETPKVEATPETPKVETVEQPEVFDPERAKATIQAQRESEKALKAQVKELSAKAKRADELEAAEAKRKEEAMSETERLQKQLADTQALLKSKEHAELQRVIADKVGLPPALASRLQGDTEEALEADAKSLLETLPKTPKVGSPNPTNPGNAASPPGETEAQQRARIYGNADNIFDKNYLNSIGGGVVIKQKVG
jgi:hypothetical protein